MQGDSVEAFWAHALEYPPKLTWKAAFESLAKVCRKDLDIPERKKKTRYGFLLGNGDPAGAKIVPDCESWDDVQSASDHWNILLCAYSFANHLNVAKVYIGMTHISSNSSHLSGLASRGAGYDHLVLIAKGDFGTVENAERYLHRTFIHPKKEGDPGYPGVGQKSLYGLYLCFSKRDTSEEERILVYYRSSGEPWKSTSVRRNAPLGRIFGASAVWKLVDAMSKWQALNLYANAEERGRYYFLPTPEPADTEEERYDWPYKPIPSFIQQIDTLRTAENSALLINVNNSLVTFVRGFGDDVDPDSAIVQELDAIMELKRVVYALLANLKETENTRTRTMLGALMWGLYHNLLEAGPFSNLLRLPEVKEYFQGADSFIFWQNIGNCSFLLHILNNTPLHGVLEGSRGDLLWIAFVLYMERREESLEDALVSIIESGTLINLFKKWRNALDDRKK